MPSAHAPRWPPERRAPAPAGGRVPPLRQRATDRPQGRPAGHGRARLPRRPEHPVRRPRVAGGGVVHRQRCRARVPFQRLRQRPVRVLPVGLDHLLRVRTDRPHPLADAGGGPHGGLRLPRGLLQPASAALRPCLSESCRVRKEAPGPDRRLAPTCPRKRGNSSGAIAPSRTRRASAAPVSAMASALITIPWGRTVKRIHRDPTSRISSFTRLLIST